MTYVIIFTKSASKLSSYTLSSWSRVFGFSYTQLVRAAAAAGLDTLADQYEEDEEGQHTDAQYHDPDSITQLVNSMFTSLFQEAYSVLVLRLFSSFELALIIN